MSKQNPIYCRCGHSETYHTIYEDLDPAGEAPAKCKRCECDRFCYDSYLSHEKDNEAREMRDEARYERFRDED